MSNSLGSIYGTTKNGDKHIKVNTDYFDVSATFLISKNGIQFNKNQSELLNNDNSLINKVNNMLNTNNDASFNNVDVSGTLNVQGEKVMTVPSLDICGNDLSANTTYEITTGPPGSINNISFVKKQESYFLSATGNLSNPLHSQGDSHPIMKNWSILCASTSASGDLSATTGKWTCPATGVYFIYYQSYYTGRYLEQAHTAINIHNPGVNDNTNPNLSVDYTPVVGFMFTPFRSDGHGQDPHRDDVGDVVQPITTMRTITQGERVHLTMRVASGGYHNIYGNAELQIRRIN